MALIIGVARILAEPLHHAAHITPLNDLFVGILNKADDQARRTATDRANDNAFYHGFATHRFLPNVKDEPRPQLARLLRQQET